MDKPLKIFKNLYEILDTIKDNEIWCFYWQSILDYYFNGIEPDIKKEDQIDYAFWTSIKSLVDIAQTDRRSITSAINGKNHKKKNTDLEYEDE